MHENFPRGLRVKGGFYAYVRSIKISYAGLARVFSDVLVAFLYFDICHYRQSNLAIENPEFSQPVVAGHFQ